MTDKSVILVLIDGLGIGVRDPAINPLAQLSPRVLRLFSDESPDLPGGGVLKKTDVTMGVPGRPQSATGHTALLTGINSARVLGRHLTGFPNKRLRQLIERHSLFQKLRQRERSTLFANTFSPPFFEKRPRWVSASTVMCESAGVPLMRLDDLVADRALYMDLSNELLQRQGYPVPIRSAREAARILVEIAGPVQLCYFEYFLTDRAGHRRDFKWATSLLQQLDDFIWEIVNRLRPHQSLIVTSDHGNVENLTQRQHTLNPVGTLVWGEMVDHFPAGKEIQLTQIAPLIEDYLTADWTLQKSLPQVS